jgi:GWxTD domain-containing protein
MRITRVLLLLVLLGLGLNTGSFSNSPPEKKGSDQVDHYKKWIENDVIWIISDDEKKVFKALKNDEERENFIEDFWNRRNPDPRSSNNAFKEEHYRRIAYANQNYHSGIPGWRTDRGRIYIMYGQPDQKEEHPTGGQYDRPIYEGGGSTSTFPFEKWWYRNIEGIGPDIEIEFVDPSFTGEYKIAMSPDEKDSLINVEGSGLTLAEQWGLSEKRDRAYFNPGAFNDSPANMFARAKDSPFNRMEQYFMVQRPPKIKFEDLKGVVTTHITYNNLPYNYRVDYLRLSSDKVLVPITLELNNSDLEFKKERDFNRATVNVYGAIAGLNNRMLAEWEDPISTEFSDRNFQLGKNKISVYQHTVALPPGTHCKLSLVLEDINSKNMVTTEIGLTVPKYTEGEIQSSTIILADRISEAPPSSDQLGQFVIGDMKIVPNVKSEYTPGKNLYAYMQIYNMSIDQTNSKPSLDIKFLVKSKDKVIKEMPSSSNNSEQLFYGPRVVFLGKIPIMDLAPGQYSLEITVLDKISNKTHTTTTNFIVKEPAKTITTANP